MEEKYKYYAFISYKSEDEKWAKWLQNKLERYRLPSVLCKKNPNLPRRLKPCFRYHTDIGINELKKELQTKLEKSQYLIVVCSPKSTRSTWVGDEIEAFVQLGRKDKIIPFIVEGIPYSNDERECLHSVIKQHFPRLESHYEDKEILGANINEEGDGKSWIKKEKAVVKVIAKMQNLEFDEIWQRQKRRIRRNSFAILLALFCLVGVGSFAYSKIQPKTVNFVFKEISAHNENLPALKNAFITTQIGEELRRDTLKSLHDTLVFYRVPDSLIGKKAHVVFQCEGFLPMDTMIFLKMSQEIGIRRNDSVYGNIELTLFQSYSKLPLSKTEVYVDNFVFYTDEQGCLKCFIPLSMQDTIYELKILGYKLDTIAPTYNLIGQSKSLIKL